MSFRLIPLEVQFQIFQYLSLHETLCLRKSFFPIFLDVPRTEEESKFLKQFHNMPVERRLEYRAHFLWPLMVIEPQQAEIEFMYTKFNKLSVVQQHKLKPAIKWLVWLKREDRKRKQANDPRHLKKEKAKAKRACGK